MRSEPGRSDALHFQSLAYTDQLNTIWQRGKLLEARRIPGFWLHLYALNSFFVEAWVCQRRYDVTLLRVLTDTNELTPYLDKVSLDELPV